MGRRLLSVCNFRSHLLRYCDGLALQEGLAAARKAGAVGDVLLLLQVKPRLAARDLIGPDRLLRRGAAFHLAAAAHTLLAASHSAAAAAPRAAPPRLHDRQARQPGGL
jgi:hypothetical protein